MPVPSHNAKHLLQVILTCMTLCISYLTLFMVRIRIKSISTG